LAAGVWGDGRSVPGDLGHPLRTVDDDTDIDLDRLTTTILALEASHERLGWGSPGRLYGIARAGTWAQLDEGAPYDIVDRFTPLPGEDLVAVALVCEGWCTPVDREDGRSRRGGRHRLRAAVLVSRAGDRVSVLRRCGGQPRVVGAGHGALMDRLLALVPRLAAPAN
jgi:hypothetical protein